MINFPSRQFIFTSIHSWFIYSHGSYITPVYNEENPKFSLALGTNSQSKQMRKFPQILFSIESGISTSQKSNTYQTECIKIWCNREPKQTNKSLTNLHFWSFKSFNRNETCLSSDVFCLLGEGITFIKVNSIFIPANNLHCRFLRYLLLTCISGEKLGFLVMILLKFFYHQHLHIWKTTTITWPGRYIFVYLGFQPIRIWLYVLIVSRTFFGVNPYSIVSWVSRSSLLETGAK